MEWQAAQVSALSGCAGSEGELETIRRKVTGSHKVPSGVTQIEERGKADISRLGKQTPLRILRGLMGQTHNSQVARVPQTGGHDAHCLLLEIKHMHNGDKYPGGGQAWHPAVTRPPPAQSEYFYTLVCCFS